MRSRPGSIEPNTLLIEIATRNVAHLSPNDTVGEAARVMSERHISSLVIANAGAHPQGVITESDVLRAMLSGTPQDTQLQEIMSAPVITVPDSISCLEAYQLCLLKGIRHLVVVDKDNRLSGVVSETDFRLHINLTALTGRRLIASTMNRSVLSLPRQGRLLDALSLLQAHRDCCVVVVEEGCPVGILTERDIVRLYCNDPAHTDIAIGTVMTTPVLTIPLGSTTSAAAELMLHAKVRHLVVTDTSGKLAGLVTEHDLTQTLVQGLTDERSVVDGLFLRTLINNIPDLIWLKDTDGVYLACNPRFERFFGAPEKDIVGKSDFDFIPGELAEFFRSHDRNAMESDEPCINEEWVTYADDGHRELLETIKTPMRDAQGKLIGILGIARDITARKRIETALAESELRYRTLIENSPFCIHEIGLDGRLQSMNPAGLNMLGLDDEHKICGIPYLSAVSEQDGGRIKALLSEALNGTASHFEFAASGTAPLYFKSCFIPIKDADNNVVRLMGITEDITERKRTESALYFVAQRGWEDHAENFFDALAQYLGQALGVDYVVIDRLDTDPSVAETIALYARGTIIPNMRYALKGTPCENVIGKDFCLYSKNVQQLFPTDNLLTEMGVESYAGIPLWDSTGQALGLIAVMDSKPLHDEAMLAQILSVVATRAAAELERKLSEDRLRKSEIKYRELFENAGDGIFIQSTRGVIDCNEKGANLYGRSRTELLGCHPAELAPQRQPDGRLSTEVAEEIIAAALNGDSRQFEWQALRADGTLLDVEIKLNRMELQGEICLQAVVRDISARKQAEIALRESAEKLRNLYELSPLGIALTDMNGHYVEFNGAFQRICGYTRDELNKLDYWALTPKKYAAEETVQLESLAKTGRYGPYEKEYLQKSGALIPLRLNGVLVTGKDGQQYIWSIVEDITASKLAEANLRITASVFDTTQEAIVITDANNTIIDVNPAFSTITGYRRDEVLGQNPKILNSGRQDRAFYTDMWRSLTETRAWRGEVWNRRKNGEVYAEMLSISVICDTDGRVQRHVGVFSDITYFKDHEAELSRIANYDALTGVPNRRLLADRLRQAIAHARRNHKLLAICYLDLDGFKDVNDHYGHEAGDKLLMDISRRLQEMLRAGDTLARLGGDEFVVLFNDLAREQECYQVLDRILNTISSPVDVGTGHVTVSASIGVTFYPSEDADGDTLLRHADQAMYTAKQTGKNRYHLYDSAHDRRVRALHESRRHILAGLKNTEFELFYQPKIELTSGDIIGVEALIRWHHPERGLLLPAEFLPFIEDSDLEIQLGNWVMDTAMAQIDAWHKDGLDLEVSINISANHLQSPGFVADLARRLSRYPQMLRNRLQIEVLESAALEDIASSAETINACRELGVNFALDDFGTGYSSLAYLRKLSAETLKIDQSFVRGMLTDEGDRAIVQGIIALAKTFGRKTVAEGIEAAELTQMLIEVGCMYGQGYGIAHPMSAEDFMQWRKKRK